MKKNPNLPPLPNPQEVENYPHHIERAIISRKSAENFYVVIRQKGDDNKWHETILGRIIDGRYYSMEEYHQTFHRSYKDNRRRLGETEETPAPTRKYIRHKPLTERRLKDGIVLPKPEEIENFPFEVEGARLLMNKKVLYVVTSTFYKTADGKRKEDRRYLGRVVNGRFYTTDEYRTLFKRDGTLRNNA